MPTVAKRGKTWRARARVNGVQVDAGAHATKTEALAAALEMERSARAGRAPRGTLFRHLLERYASQVSPSKKGARWETNRLAYYGRDDIALTPVAKLTPTVFAALRDRRLREGVSGSSILRDFNLLSHVCKVAWKEWVWLEGNPTTDVRRPRENPPRDRRVQAGEVEALRLASGYRPNEAPETATARAIAAFEFCVETAMRSGELVALEWRDIAGLTVRVRDSKNGLPRTVPLSARASEIVDQLRPLRLPTVFGLSSSILSALFRKVRGRAGIVGLNFHDSRREATTRLARQFDVLDLSRITGHQDLAILRNVYYQPTAEELAQRMRAGQRKDN